MRAYTRVEVKGSSQGPVRQLPNTRLLTCKQLKADTRLANWQLQTVELEKTGKPDCQLAIEGLVRLATSRLPNMPRSLVAPDKQGPADIYIYIYMTVGH